MTNRKVAAMTESIVNTEIDRLLESLDGALVSRSRVVDALLDVRGATKDYQLIALVDTALRSIPGKNAAETEWLRERLVYFALMADMSAILTEDTTVAQ